MRRSLKAREARLAFYLLLPTVTIVLLIVIFPVVANFWIAFKDIRLGDLRAPKAVVRERILKTPTAPGEQLVITYRVENRSKNPIVSTTIRDSVPAGLAALTLPPECTLAAGRLTCRLAGPEPRQRVTLTVTFLAEKAYFDAGRPSPRANRPLVETRAKNPLLAKPWTAGNLIRVFQDPDFWPMLWVTLAYTVFGTTLSILLGLFAAQLLVVRFRGRNLFRGLFLFPYVAPVIAVAFVWVFLLDPFSGTVNALLQKYGVASQPIPFLSQRTWEISAFGASVRIPLALTAVILFEGWRYFPFAFLFILARMQAMPAVLFEAARVDGAGPWQTFRHVTLPQLLGILGTLFLLRFIWTFNKFDDIFLLTGGAAGTETITIKVYDYAFARADLGLGAALAVVLFFILAFFLSLYFRFAPKGEV